MPKRICTVYLSLLLIPWATAFADITGVVVDDPTGDPVDGARVRVQATTDAPAVTGPDGTFSLTGVPAGTLRITAVPPYESTRATNYITGSVSAADGDDVEIRLTRLPADDVDPYFPGTSFNCASCHAGQHGEWQDSNHSNAGVNEWVLDLFSGDGTPGGGAGYVFRDTHDPGDTGFCATCHAPLEDAQDPGNVMLNELELPSGMDGVTCLACHQMAEVNDEVDALHHLGNTLYRFPDGISPEYWVWGPLDDVSFSVMRPSYQPGFSQARFCASCHEYNNPDTGAPGQNTYTEWLASPYAQPGDDFRACQDCHMPAADAPGPISTVSGSPIRPGSQRRSHAFTGATPDTLSDAIELDLEAMVEGGELVVNAQVTNAGAGHFFPTGISIRNAILAIEAEVEGQGLLQTQGEVIPFYGSADGGDGEGDLAGRPGKGYARVLEGRINGSGPVVRPVLFIDAEGVWADTRIPSGQSDATSYRFALPADIGEAQATVTARLLYRRAWRNLAETKGWTVTPSGGPVEIEVASRTQQVAVSGGGPALPIPVMDRWALLALILGLLVLAVWAIRAAGPRKPESPG